MLKKLLAAALLSVVVCTGAFAALPEGIVKGPGIDLELEDPSSTIENPVLKVTVPEYTLKADPNINDEFLKYQWHIPNSNTDVVWNAFAEGKYTRHEPSHVFLIVIDTGIDLHHQDIDMSGVPYNTSGLMDKYGVYGVASAEGGNVEDITMDNTTVWPMPENFLATHTYHGTYVAGLAGAAANGIGVVGMAPGITLIPVNRQYPDKEDNRPTFTQQDHAALTEYVADELIPWLKDTYSDARIIVNMSYRVSESGGDGQPSTSYAAYEKLMKMEDVLFTIASGNDGELLSEFMNKYDGEVMYPYMYCDVNSPNIITVAAHGYKYRWSGGSNYGTDRVDISAPGTDVLCLGTGTDSDPLDLQKKSYNFCSGTSMAAPVVAGAAALLWQAYPDATAAQIKQMIVEGAKTTTGNEMYDIYSGEKLDKKITDFVKYGFLDVAASFRAAPAIMGHGEEAALEIPLKEITITLEDKSKTTLSVVGDTCKATAATAPFNADSKEIVWKSSNPSVLSVDENTGVYTAAKNVDAAETVKIWAEPKNPASGELAASVKSNEIEITVATVEVAVPPSTLEIMNAQDEIIESVEVQPRATFALSGYVEPAEGQGVTWEVEDPTIVELVSASGLNAEFRALKAGSTTIKMASAYMPEIYDTIEVTVAAELASPVSVTLSHTSASLNPGGTLQLIATVLPAEATYSIQYESSNPSVATVTSDGLVTAVSVGSAKITAVTDNDLTAECAITVTEEAVTPPPATSDGGGGGSGGCNAGFGVLALIAAIPLIIKRKKQ